MTDEMKRIVKDLINIVNHRIGDDEPDDMIMLDCDDCREILKYIWGKEGWGQWQERPM